MSVRVNLTHAMAEELAKNMIILTLVFVRLIVQGISVNADCRKMTYVFQCSMAIHL